MPSNTDFAINSIISLRSSLKKPKHSRLLLQLLTLFPPVLFLCLVTGEALIAQDAQSILRMMYEKKQERLQDVEDYTITMSMDAAMGMQTAIYHEKITVDKTVTFRQIPKPIYERDMQIQAGFPPPEEVSAEMAKAMKIAAPHMNQGGPASMFQLDWDQMILFAEAGAVAYDSISDGTEEATINVQDMKMLMQKAKLVGKEQVVATSEMNNRPAQTREAFHIVADGLGDIALEQPEGGGEYQINSMSWWIDTKEYVPLAFQMDGEVENNGAVTPITIGGKNLDYRQVGPMYEAHTNIYQISGLMGGMSEKEKKKMEKAKADLAKAKADLEKMPADQQAMMKKMMGDKFTEMENMLQGDSFETRMKVESIAINEGPVAVYGLGSVDFQPALTIAMEGVSKDGSLVGQLDISVGPLAERGELKLLLEGDAPWPMPGETMLIKHVSGHLIHDKSMVDVTGASGSITVDYRSETHIRGTYTVDLKFAGGSLPTINGTFKSPPPLGPGQAPIGSPIPGNLFGGQD